MNQDLKGVGVIDQLYLHIGNSGVTFEVADYGHGVTLVVDSGSFGNIDNNFRVHTNVEDLKRLGEMFLRCAERDFGEPYCHQARSQEYREENCCGMEDIGVHLDVKSVDCIETEDGCFEEDQS